MRDFIEAREGYVLTNGEIYGKRIYLAEGVEKSAFKEITEEAYNAMQEEQNGGLNDYDANSL